MINHQFICIEFIGIKDLKVYHKKQLIIDKLFLDNTNTSDIITLLFVPDSNTIGEINRLVISGRPKLRLFKMAFITSLHQSDPIKFQQVNYPT